LSRFSAACIDLALSFVNSFGFYRNGGSKKNANFIKQLKHKRNQFDLPYLDQLFQQQMLHMLYQHRLLPKTTNITQLIVNIKSRSSINILVHSCCLLFSSFHVVI
jgi:hypothetical protein